MAKKSTVKREWTTQDLTDAYNEYIQRIEDIYSKFDDLMAANPAFAVQSMQNYQGDKEKYRKAMLAKGEYCMTIRTQAQWEKQQDRCEDIISMGGELDIPVVVGLDLQLMERRVIVDGNFPTYYSTWANPLFDNGNPGYFIAYPCRISEMTDNEVKIALAHEFGHIKQKHIFEDTSDVENVQDINQAMDYSINWGFNHDDIKTYQKVAEKMFQGGVGATKVPFPKKQGGLDNQVNISHQWREILTLIKILNQDKEGDSGDGPPPPEEIEVGNIIKERKKGGGYSRVTDVDPLTGAITADPMTQEEFEEARKEAGQGKGGPI